MGIVYYSLGVPYFDVRRTVVQGRVLHRVRPPPHIFEQGAC